MRKGKGEKMAAPLKGERVKRWLRQLMNKYVKLVLENLENLEILEILGKLGKLETLEQLEKLEKLEKLELENLEQPNPHPLLLAIQRLYYCLSHGFQRIAVDVLQVIV